MRKESYNVIGVMSGTSLDGIDLARIRFFYSEARWRFEIFECETVGYSQEWIDRLKIAVDFNADSLQKLNLSYTQLLANIISGFIDKLELKDIDAVCSHGHTILHKPENGITLQIGNLPAIASLLNQVVVCDFRVQDVALNGQGAPLVPIGDRILFSEFDYCLNLGGFSNISFEQSGRRIAFDICAVNTVLNIYAEKLGQAYDNKGLLAKSGTPDQKLLNELNSVDYYKRPFPKSLGFESVKEIMLPIIESYKGCVANKLHTFTEHIAMQISLALPLKKGNMLVTGGGAYNDYLIERIQYFLPDVEITIPEKKILEFKEALIFAFLGVLRLRNEINVLSSVTGAKHDHCSGNVFMVSKE